MATTVKVPNRDIAIRAFDYLRREHKTFPALRLAYHLFHHEGISLGIGDTDWDIDMALQRYGGERRAENRIRAFRPFQLQRENVNGAG